MVRMCGRWTRQGRHWCTALAACLKFLSAPAGLTSPACLVWKMRRVVVTWKVGRVEGRHCTAVAIWPNASSGFLTCMSSPTCLAGVTGKLGLEAWSVALCMSTRFVKAFLYYKTGLSGVESVEGMQGEEGGPRKVGKGR
jgi:hypothetical protein